MDEAKPAAVDLAEKFRNHGNQFPIKDSAEWIDFASLYLVEAADEIARLRDALCEIEALEGEVNFSNYDHEDVVILNNSLVAAVLVARAALGIKQ